MRKLGVIFVSIRKYGSSESHGLMGHVETAGPPALPPHPLGRSRIRRPLPLQTAKVGFRPIAALCRLFLALVAACILPYVVGFAYTRHVSILIYPAALMCCRMLQDGENGS